MKLLKRKYYFFVLSQKLKKKLLNSLKLSTFFVKNKMKNIKIKKIKQLLLFVKNFTTGKVLSEIFLGKMTKLGKASSLPELKFTQN